jgi:ketohexokinase
MPDDLLYHQPAFEVPRVVDTVGAGDVFNAAVIDALLADGDVRRAMRRGCRLAASKCARIGLENLAMADMMQPGEG